MYSPVIGGRPASSAYAIPCGTSSAVRTNPATTSWRSHAPLYDDRLAIPGATRAITGPARVGASDMGHIVAPTGSAVTSASTANRSQAASHVPATAPVSATMSPTLSSPFE